MQTGQRVILPISSADKPAVPSTVMDKWQEMVDLVTKSLDVPTGLIMKINTDNIEVAVSSRTSGNPYGVADKEELCLGLYCETVVATRDTLHIPDALSDELWKDNPDVKLGMIAYLGMPLCWPDGETFGTICVLDNTPHTFSDLNAQLMGHFRSVVESDLCMLIEHDELKRLSSEKEIQLRETHHRVKNHLSMLSNILQLQLHEGDAKAIPEALFTDLLDRIRSIAKLHSQVAEDENMDVGLGPFLESISNTIIRTLSPRDVKLRYSSENFEVNQRTLFHCGLLVSELMTNTLKHAFLNTFTPIITISVKDMEGGMFELSFSDNGTGHCVHPTESQSIGMMLIDDLPHRMGGTYTHECDNGTRYAFVLKKNA